MNDLQPGTELTIFFGEGNPNNRVVHIRAIVDDEYIVIRSWGEKGWQYEVKDRSYFDLLFEHGYVK